MMPRGRREKGAPIGLVAETPDRRPRRSDEFRLHGTDTSAAFTRPVASLLSTGPLSIQQKWSAAVQK